MRRLLRALWLRVKPFPPFCEQCGMPEEEVDIGWGFTDWKCVDCHPAPAQTEGGA